MKWSAYVLFGAVAVQLAVCANFSPVDQEIFQINHELKQDLGEDADFYEWLKLPKRAKSSYDEITKAYKKLSVRLHPDKFQQRNRNKYPAKKFKKLAKLNNDRYERLSAIGEILRSDRKARYDFYLSNGFPKWDGSGFFYSRFKPGFVLTVAVVFVIVAVLHYVLLRVQRNQERKRVQSLKEQIKTAAWPNGYPPADFSDRKITVPSLEKDFLVKGDGSVHLIEAGGADGSEIRALHPVDAADIADVTFRDSFFYRLPVAVWNWSVARLVPAWEITAPVQEEGAQKPEGRKPDAPKKKKNTGEKKELPNGKVVYGASKAGGRRRK